MIITVIYTKIHFNIIKKLFKIIRDLMNIINYQVNKKIFIQKGYNKKTHNFLDKQIL